MNFRVIVTETAGQQTGVSALAVDVLIGDVDGRNVTTQLTLQWIDKIHGPHLQNGRGLDGKGPIQQDIVRPLVSPEVVVTLANYQSTEGDQNSGEY